VTVTGSLPPARHSSSSDCPVAGEVALRVSVPLEIPLTPNVGLAGGEVEQGGSRVACWTRGSRRATRVAAMWSARMPRVQPFVSAACAYHNRRSAVRPKALGVRPGAGPHPGRPYGDDHGPAIKVGQNCGAGGGLDVAAIRGHSAGCTAGPGSQPRRTSAPSMMPPSLSTT
jgi:hypothetical protein